MGIVSHVGSDKSPLGKLLLLQVLIEMSEVLDLASLGLILDDRVVKHERVVLADIVVCISILVGVIVALVAGVWQVLLVLAPRDTLGVEKINNGGDIFRDLVEVVIVHSKGVTTGSGTVIGLRRVRQSIEVGTVFEVRLYWYKI